MARNVDDEGKVLDLLVQRRCSEAVAVKLMRKLMKKQGCAPDVPVTARPRSYAAAKAELKLTARHGRGRRRNNRGENSPLPGSPTRAQDAAFQIAGSAQRFAFCLSLEPSTITSTFSDLISRSTLYNSRRGGAADVVSRDRRH